MPPAAIIPSSTKPTIVSFERTPQRNRKQSTRKASQAKDAEGKGFDRKVKKK
jgi:hypothetical protein